MGSSFERYMREQSNTAAPEPDTKPSSSFDAFMQTSDTAPLLKQSARIGSKAAPDSAARVLSLTKRTGLPQELIERNLDSVEQAVSRADFDPVQFAKESP